MLADILAGQLSVYSWVSIYAEKWIILLLGKIIFSKSYFVQSSSIFSHSIRYHICLGIYCCYLGVKLIFSKFEFDTIFNDCIAPECFPCVIHAGTAHWFFVLEGRWHRSSQVNEHAQFKWFTWQKQDIHMTIRGLIHMTPLNKNLDWCWVLRPTKHWKVPFFLNDIC